ncbi:carnitine O-palmitoyltransferase 2 [Pelomyxa schiedti]|nr:carnitine O-palmitoyltransferase 2 [Pelomyxa schiedti]
MATTNATTSIGSLLFTEARDFLLGKEGRHVTLSDLAGKTVGLYFSGHWCPPCRGFTPQLATVYKEIVAQGKAFEIVFVSSDRSQHDFDEYFNEMPWIALPYDDRDTKQKLSDLYKIQGIPSLVILGPDGTTLTEDGRECIDEYGAKAFPFTPEHIGAFKAEAEREHAEMVANQCAKVLLCTPTRDWVLGAGGAHVEVASLHGTPLGILFSMDHPQCRGFDATVRKTYETLKAQNKPFQIVEISLDEAAPASVPEVPWLYVPHDHALANKLAKFFELYTLPTMIVLDAAGKTATTEGAAAVQDFGAEAYPFTTTVIDALRAAKAEKLKIARENQTLASLLTTPSRDYVINGAKEHVLVSSLADNERIGIYFSGHWCGPCRAFTPILASVYKELKAAGKKFEVIFVSSDRSQEDFDSYFAEMPWLAIPFTDREAKATLGDHFEIEGIPTLILLDSAGKNVSLSANDLVSGGKAEAFPWTPEKMEEARIAKEKLMATLPKWIKHAEHEHPLELCPSVYRGMYRCNVCRQVGEGYAYHCVPCQFDSHPECAKGMPACDPPATPPTTGSS